MDGDKQPMIDDTPYIIVDNQKIAPIAWTPRAASAADDKPGHEERPFGIVDRVTISKEAREKSRWHQAQADMTFPVPAAPPAPQQPAPIRLTYAPKKQP